MIADYRPAKTANALPLIRYRCRLRSDRAVPEAPKGHPSNIYLHQDVVMASVDRWLSTELNDPAWIAAASGPDEAEAARIEALQGNLSALDRKIANLVSVVEGSDDAPEVLISQLSARSLERDRMKSEITRLAARQAMAAEDVQVLIDHVGGFASALESATDDEKADLYQELGLDLTYEPLAHQLRAELLPGGRPNGRVQRGSYPPSLRKRYSTWHAHQQ